MSDRERLNRLLNTTRSSIDGPAEARASAADHLAKRVQTAMPSTPSAMAPAAAQEATKEPAKTLDPTGTPLATSAPVTGPRRNGPLVIPRRRGSGHTGATKAEGILTRLDEAIVSAESSEKPSPPRQGGRLHL